MKNFAILLLTFGILMIGASALMIGYTPSESESYMMNIMNIVLGGVMVIVALVFLTQIHKK